MKEARCIACGELSRNWYSHRGHIWCAYCWEDRIRLESRMEDSTATSEWWRELIKRPGVQIRREP